jgi:hypothetical protein
MGAYEVEEEVEDSKGRVKTVPITLRETFYVYGVVCDEDDHVVTPGACMSFWSTKIRAYRTWMTRLRQCMKVPLYAHYTQVTCKQETNPEGSYYVPILQPADPRGVRHSLLRPDDERFLLARALRESILSGTERVDYASASASEASGDEEIPF